MREGGKKRRKEGGQKGERERERKGKREEGRGRQRIPSANPVGGSIHISIVAKCLCEAYSLMN